MLARTALNGIINGIGRCPGVVFLRTRERVSRKKKIFIHGLEWCRDRAVAQISLIARCATHAMLPEQHPRCLHPHSRQSMRSKIVSRQVFIFLIMNVLAIPPA